MTPDVFQLAGQPAKIVHSRGESRPPSNTWFLWPTRVYPPIGISICSAVLQAHEHTDYVTPFIATSRIACLFI